MYGAVVMPARLCLSWVIGGGVGRWRGGEEVCRRGKLSKRVCRYKRLKVAVVFLGRFLHATMLAGSLGAWVNSVFEQL